MNHNYKLTDFKNPEYETDIDLMDINVTIFLRNSLELPLVLEQRLEGIVNNLISEYEHENNSVIPLENMDDEQYEIIRKFFFVKLNEYVSEQIKRIEKSV